MNRESAKFSSPDQMEMPLGVVEWQPFSTFPFTVERDKPVRILPRGKWTHPKYGKVEIDDTAIEELVAHFDLGLAGKELPIEFPNHATDGAGSFGWITRLFGKEDGLWAEVEWTDYGWDMVFSKRYRYASVEAILGKGVFTDPATGKTYSNVLSRVSPTNRPFFKELTETPLAASDEQEPEESQPESKGSENNMEEKTFSAEDLQPLMASIDALNAGMSARDAKIAELMAKLDSQATESMQFQTKSMIEAWRFDQMTVVDDKVAKMSAALAPAHRELVFAMLGELGQETGAEFIKCMGSGGFQFVPLGEVAVLSADAPGEPKEEDPTEALKAEYPEDTVLRASAIQARTPGLTLEAAIDQAILGTYRQ